MVIHDKPCKQVCRAHPTDTQTQNSRQEVVHAPSSLAHLTHQVPSPTDAWSQMGQKGPGTGSSEPVQPARNLQQLSSKGHCCPCEAGVGKGAREAFSEETPEKLTASLGEAGGCERDSQQFPCATYRHELLINPSGFSHVSASPTSPRPKKHKSF